MRFTTFAIVAFGIFTSVAAIRDLKHFKIRTRVLEGNTKFCGLWASLYHTGAGLADITFQDNQTAGFSAFINKTQFQWVYSGVTYIPFSTNLKYEPYTAWSSLEVSPGYGNVDPEAGGIGFKIASDNSLVSKQTKQTTFGGWLVCDWWHQVPELFWYNSYYNLTLINSCAKVALLAVV